MTRCDDCRFWSQMVAFAHGGGPVKALCLADGGSMSGKYTSGRQIGCGFKPDLFGKVDDPPNYGEYTRQAYIDEEGADALSAAQVSA